MQTEPHKYLVIEEYIINLIKTCEFGYGEKIPSENSISKKFDISRQTVRQAINNLQNEGWLKSVRGSGTFVNKTIERTKKETKNIGAIITYPDDYIFPNIIKGIENTLSDAGYNLNLSFTYNKVEKEAQCLQSFVSKDIDAMIIESTKSALPNPNLKLFLELSNKNIPFIFINGYYNELNASYIVMDDEKGGELATKYLINEGHTKIAGIFKSDDIQGHLRYKGFVKAQHNANLEVLENSVFWYSTEDIDGVFSLEYSNIVLNRFKDCTAIVCYNDQIAVKLIEIIKINKKKVPEDYSIISFDNSSLAELSSPKLTTLTHLGITLGNKAAIAILDMIKTGKIHKEKLEPEIIERNSVKTMI